MTGLNFREVETSGQAFADELFRVYALAHPQAELLSMHMTQKVERIWLRVVTPKG